jgi:hypothetical protein
VKYPVALFVEIITIPAGDDPVTVTVHVAKVPTCTVLGEHDAVSEDVVRVVDGFTTFNEKLPLAGVL